LTTFLELGLAAPLQRALGEEGYTTPTPIQTKAIPVVMTGADLLGIAQTGTGKTAAFALPILHRLAAHRRPTEPKRCRVLVLSPTRELASQIADSFRAYSRHQPTRIAVVFGGVGHRPQIQALARGLDVLVATPGRLIDHLEAGALDLSATEVLVLDEADQMLDLGFVKPIRRIVARLPRARQSLFFSATMPVEIGELADELLVKPVKVSVAPAATTVERVTQRVIHVEQTRKRALLVELLADAAMARTLVFTRTKRGADRVARHLEASAIPVAAIHGNKSQQQRERALAAFKESRIRVLVATDIAARGIDVDGVTHVVNFEIPDVPESYVHRIGRTARAGAAGIAISLVDAAERDQLRDIERVTRQRFEPEDRRNDRALTADRPLPGSAGRASREQARRPQRPARQAGSPAPARSHAVTGAPRSSGRTSKRSQPQSRAGNQSRPDSDGRPGDLSGVAFLQRQPSRPTPAVGEPEGRRPVRRQERRTG
jgi:ATP-dependent RNA helicase RhlE